MAEALWLLAMLLAGLAAGVAFSHILEIPGKRRLAEADALLVQQNLYLGYRTPSAVIEAGAFVAAVAATVVAAEREAAEFWLTLGAAAAIAATTVIFFAVTDIANRRIARWEPGRLPADWHATRNRWELSHALRAGLFLLALGLLAGAAIAD